MRKGGGVTREGAGLMKEGRGDVEMDFPLIPSPPFDRFKDHRERG